MHNNRATPVDTFQVAIFWGKFRSIIFCWVWGGSGAYILKAKKFAEPPFQPKKIAEKVQVIFGPFWVILGPFWTFLGHLWAI